MDVKTIAIEERGWAQLGMQQKCWGFIAYEQIWGRGCVSGWKVTKRRGQG